MAFFGLGVIALYTFFGRYYIPPIAPEPPPVKVILDLSTMTTDDFVAFGEMTFRIKGACTRCHGQPGARAPRLDRTAIDAENTIKLSTYRGKAVNAAEYLYESMVEPSAYVVPGYGKGFGDSVSPMPEANGRVVGLTDAEIRAIGAYLQSLAGVEVTITATGLTQKDKVSDEGATAR